MVRRRHAVQRKRVVDRPRTHSVLRVVRLRQHRAARGQERRTRKHVGLDALGQAVRQRTARTRLLCGVKIFEIEREGHAKTARAGDNRRQRTRRAAIDEVRSPGRNGGYELVMDTAVPANAYFEGYTRGPYRRGGSLGRAKSRARRELPQPRARAVVVNNLPRPRPPFHHRLIRRPRPFHMPRADDANAVAGVVKRIRRLQHARARREVSCGHDAHTRCQTISPGCHECTRRCASSTSPTASSMTNRGI